MKYERLGWFSIGLALAGAACLIEPNPDFSEHRGDCVVGELDCPCTPGGGCDPGLGCIAGTCGPEGGDPGLAYGPCPSGDDADCPYFQVCVTGADQGTSWSLCTLPCDGSNGCVIDERDDCGDLPGDGKFMRWCAPQVNCSPDELCPAGMQCLLGFWDDLPSVCIWPDP